MSGGRKSGESQLSALRRIGHRIQLVEPKANAQDGRLFAKVYSMSSDTKLSHAFDLV